MSKILHLVLRFFFVLLLWLIQLPLQSQSNISASIKEVDFFVADGLSNYYVFKQNSLCKYMQDGKSAGCKHFNINAKPLVIDVSNPYKMLVYSQSQQILYFLNSQLSELAMIKTEKISDRDYRFKNCCISKIAYFWAFDEINDNLLLFDVQLKIVRESNSLFQQTGLNIFPTEIKETNNYLIVANPEQGVFIFDLFGNYIYKIPYLYYKNIQIIDDKVYCFFIDNYRIWDIKTRYEQQTKLSSPNIKFVNIINDIMYYVDSCGMPRLIKMN